MSLAHHPRGNVILLDQNWYHFQCTDCDSSCCRVVARISRPDEVSNEYERRAVVGLGGFPEGGISLIGCRRCQTIRMDPGLTNEGQSVFFDCFYQLGGGTYDDSWWARLQANRLKGIAKLISAPGRLLDIGCGTGLFPEEASRMGWEGWGHERSPVGYETAKARLKGKALTGDLRSIPNSWADCVTLFSVVEHNMNPVTVLQEAARICRPEGWVVFNVPNAGSLEARVSSAFGAAWLGFNVSHCWYWTERSLRALTKQVGLIPRVVESVLPLFSFTGGRKEQSASSTRTGPLQRRTLSRRLMKAMNPMKWWGMRALLNTPFDASFLGKHLSWGSYLFVYAQKVSTCD